MQEIVVGAIEAGAPTDVVSRCAVDVGADVKEVARCVMSAAAPGLCYYEPEGLGYSAPAGAGLAPIEVGLPGGDPGGGFISPSTF